MMAGGTAGSDFTNQLNTLTQVGVVGNLSDGQLLQRYLTTPDGGLQVAFTVLVERHGPMVLRVCRQVLGDSHDAQDAFQATFLVLARKAESVRKAESLGSWLHGVALRCASRARADASRRRVYERRGAMMRGAGPEREGVRPESWSELHEEVARLPERYREPVVLCYLEGLSTEAAALRLGCPKGTVLSRLSRARERLRVRLARRGLAPVEATAWVTASPPTPVPETLAATIKAFVATDAFRLAAGRPLTAGTIPASVLNLSTGVLHAMTLAKLKTVALAVSAAALLGMVGTGVYAFQDPDGAVRANSKPAQNTSEAPATNSFTATATERPSDSPVVEKAASEPITTVEAVTTREMAAQLALARKKLARYKQLLKRGAIPDETLDEAESQVEILKGRIQGRFEQIEEELELLKLRLEAKQAEAGEAKAEVETTQASLAGVREQIENKVFSRNELTKAEAEVRRKKAAWVVRVIEVREIELRITQLERRRRSAAAAIVNPGPDAESDPVSASPGKPASR